jgi:hypothetical protein
MPSLIDRLTTEERAELHRLTRKAGTALILWQEGATIKARIPDGPTVMAVYGIA